MCVILEKLSNPSILHLSCVPKRTVSKETAPVIIRDIFPFVKKKTAFNLANWWNYPIYQFQCNPLDFKYHTDQTMCIILEKLSNPSILTLALGAQKNHLQGNGSREHPWHFSIRQKETAFNLANWWNYPIYPFQCNHLDFKSHTDQTMCKILEKLPNPSILDVTTSRNVTFSDARR